MSDLLSIGKEVAEFYSAFPAVETVALSGSQTHGEGDILSDIDLYVYTKQEIPIDARSSMIQKRSHRAEINNRFWEPGDEWIEIDQETSVDVMFRTPEWIEEQLDRVLRRHVASIGYSTCFWHNVLTSQVLYDRNGWFEALQQDAGQPYPEPLRVAIVKKNHPILRNNISSYLHQIERAVKRKDPVSVNHRTACLLASYFDILFAINRTPHPGEKRLLTFAEQNCTVVPEGMRTNVEDLCRIAGSVDRQITDRVNRLLDPLDKLLKQERLIPQ